MLSAEAIENSWSESYWAWVHQETRQAARRAPSERAAFEAVAARARRVIRYFSRSFFIVTRFLPPVKRLQVETIYATVRYPDEVVDTFPLTPAERQGRLDCWAAGYERALGAGSLSEAIELGVPPFLAAFGRVVQDNDIPPEHYRSFLAAMRRDILPRPFDSLDDLVESYIYGSATVVGYFLAHVYGPAEPGGLPRARRSARHLAIALQLTNFLRDVAEDHRRGRLYLPTDVLAGHGISVDRFDPADPAQQEALRRVVVELSAAAETHYARSAAEVDAFAADCRIAIESCIGVYRQLNRRVGAAPDTVLERESVPILDKLRALPPSKYWRLPLAYMGLQEPLEKLVA